MARVEAPSPVKPKEFRISEAVRTESGFFRYKVNLPLHPRPDVILPLEAVELSVWSEQSLDFDTLSEFQQLISDRNPTGAFPIMLLNGLLSSSEQYDRKGNSFIRKLTDAVKSEPKKERFNPLYIGLSCPGFTGSEVDNPHPTKDDVGVLSYSKIVSSVLDEVHFSKSRGALIGHSAGGAVVHQYEHEHQDMLLKVALCPAIHLERAKQFELIKKALLLQKNTVGRVPQLGLKKLTSEEVVRSLLGLPLIGHLTPTQRAQVDMHIYEIDHNLEATIAKLDDLYKPLGRGVDTILATLTIIAEDDILTPPAQIQEGFEKEFDGFLTMPKTHHDDIFMNMDTQGMSIPVIANYLATRMINWSLADNLGMKRSGTR